MKRIAFAQLIALMSCLGVFLIFPSGNARAQLAPCTDASVPECRGKFVGAACASGFGAQMANCMSTSLNAEGEPTCACPDVDCTAPGSCFETRYGLGSPQDWRHLPDGFLGERADVGDPTAIEPAHADFVASYAFGRTDDRSSVGTCDPEGEGGFIPVSGTFILREKVGCNPFTEPGGCPVKLAQDLNLDDPSHPDHFFTEARHIADLAVCGFTPPFTLHFCELFISVASAGEMFGVGRRVPNPGGPAGSTRIVWDSALGSPGGSNSRICCNSDSADFIDLCDFVGGLGVAKYPLTPSLAGFGGPYKNFPDFIFDGDAAAPPFGSFEVDMDLIPPGSRYGVCKANRTVACDCGPGGGTIAGCNGVVASDPCPGLGDFCDIRDIGYRLSPDDRQDDGSPDPNFCAGTVYVFRGTPNENCLVSTVYAVNGNPGPDCAVRNFGPHPRPDLNCDGANDLPGDADLCPSYSEVNMLADTNGNGRGDECECGDANGDGRVNISDIVTANFSIFNPPFYPGTWFHDIYGIGTFRRILTPLMDANNSFTFDNTKNSNCVAAANPHTCCTGPGAGSCDIDWDIGGEVNVSDLVQINVDIFNPKSARCGRSPVQGQ